VTATSLLRERAHGTHVSNVELFFDLVYVVAITQLSALLRADPSWEGALGAAVLLGMIWNAWVYTAWVTNWLDPDRTATRMMLLGVMAGSLVLAAGVTDAFGDKGLWVGFAYAAMQIGRSLYTVWATRDAPSLRLNYVRILCWCSASGAVAMAGGFADGPWRLGLFALAVLIDTLGGIVQFWTPGLGRTPTAEWTIDGPHFAERCQAFVLIALGESVVGISAPLAEADHPQTAGLVATIGAFIAVAALFLLYFGRWARAGLTAIARTADPGRLAARAYHLVHPVMIAGIVLIAAGNEEVLGALLGHDEHAPDAGVVAWFCAGGAGAFVLGHALYIWLIDRRFSTPHAAALLALGALIAIAAPLHLTEFTIGIATGSILVLLLVGDALRGRRRTEGPLARAS
jgi:low temperature requirement protein LtrA